MRLKRARIGARSASLSRKLIDLYCAFGRLSDGECTVPIWEEIEFPNPHVFVSHMHLTLPYRDRYLACSLEGRPLSHRVYLRSTSRTGHIGLMGRPRVTHHRSAKSLSARSYCRLHSGKSEERLRHDSPPLSDGSASVEALLASTSTRRSRSFSAPLLDTITLDTITLRLTLASPPVAGSGNIAPKSSTTSDAPPLTPKKLANTPARRESGNSGCGYCGASITASRIRFSPLDSTMTA